jgi:glycerol-3-phosphate dehydrogenase
MSETTQDVDVLIIGAGINGAGLFRDLSAQGIRCTIIDKGDFGSGTSAAPSRLIHGGIKYLETGELGLVAQSTRERNLLLKNAPHLVTKLPTVIPIFSWWKGVPAAIRTLFGSTTAPRNRGAVLIKIGLMLYDMYGSRHRVMPRHAMWSRTSTLSIIPPLNRKIVAAGLYYDAKVSHPERLVLELVTDGLALEPTARAFNYANVADTDGKTLRIRDANGALHALKPQIVVNAAGPWIDAVNATLGLDTQLIGGTKGSHILLDHPDLIRALDGRMIYFEADDGRICLVFDYLGRALVGSTDIVADDPDAVRCDDEEIDYFLNSLRLLLPGLSFNREQIVYVYSGIRPLPRSDKTAPGLISRDHSAPILEPDHGRDWPIVSLVGGKWTTFRGFAEEVADMLLARLGRKRKTNTETMRIGGAHDFPPDAMINDWVRQRTSRTGATQDRARELLGRYGTRAEEILSLEAGQPHYLDATSRHSAEEIEFILSHELIVHLDDIVMRRTSLAVTGSLSVEALDKILEISARALGWDAARQAFERARVTEMLNARHRLRWAKRR